MKNLVIEHKFDLNSNIDVVRDEIVKDLEKYKSLVIQEDDVKTAKTLMADLNKQKKEFKDTVKDFLNVIEAPLKEFKNKTKEIEVLYDEARNTLKMQVETYEAKRLEEIKNILFNYVNEVCEANNIDILSLQWQDLIKLTAVTSTGKVAKATKEAIDNRVNAIVIEKQKAMLEEQKRQEEIRRQAEELAKQKEIEVKLQAEREKQEALRQAELEAKRKFEEEAKKPTLLDLQDNVNNNLVIEVKEYNELLSHPDNKIVNIQALFQVEVPKSIPDEVVAKKLIQRLKDEAKITTLQRVEIV